MINKNIIKQIGDKEMDRKDFLKFSAVAFVAVSGFRTIANVFIDSDGQNSSSNSGKRNNSRGFGGGSYGA